ncbi:MAG: hypothetical protein KJ687_08475 [Proteobacteria bacterium]|nr:hypothetical protein [Pseudomonadota bacterium]
MVEHKEVFCSKCGCHTFEYDRFWKEYSCKDCGWLIEDDKEVSLLNGIRNSEVTRKIPIQQQRPKPTEARKSEKEIIEKKEDQGKFIQGSVRELWRVDMRECPLKEEYTQIALDAERIISWEWGRKKLNIFNFEGKREGSIAVNGSISDAAVTSDCSRILVVLTGWEGKEILAYNLDGQMELRLKPNEEPGHLIMALDGRIFASKSMDDEFINVWDRQGNFIGGMHAGFGFKQAFGLKKRKFIHFGVAPDGSYVAFTWDAERSLGRQSGGVIVRRTPDLDEVLKISDSSERSEAWRDELLKLDEWISAKVCAACKRFVLHKDRKVCIVDVEDDKSNVILSHEIAGEGNYVRKVKITSDGRYIYYVREHEKGASFEIFDVESRTAMKDLLTFPEKTSVSFCASHDGSKLLAFVKKQKGWFSGENTVSMMSVD